MKRGHITDQVLGQLWARIWSSTGQQVSENVRARASGKLIRSVRSDMRIGVNAPQGNLRRLLRAQLKEHVQLTVEE
jgi:hypothetical protein